MSGGFEAASESGAKWQRCGETDGGAVIDSGVFSHHFGSGDNGVSFSLQPHSPSSGL